MHWLPAILILPYFFLLLKIYRSLQKIEPFSVKNIPSVFVSVVVACRNEEKDLPLLLKNISEQKYPPEKFEVIIVDDNSSDSTNQIASDFKGIQNITVISNQGEGKKQALKSGISLAKGTLILTTDTDCRMGLNWIGSIAGFYETTNADMIIAPVKIEESSGFFGNFQELEFLSLQGITAGTANLGRGTMCNGANLAFKKDAYFKNSENLRFDIPTGDDVFFLHSLKEQHGSKILWLESPDAIVTTSDSASVKEFLNQRQRWLSKGSAYTDINTILLAIVTFVTILLQISIFIAALINEVFIPVFMVCFFMKSVPDYLILQNTVKRYNRKTLINWFIPVQLLYPFYVIVVAGYTVLFPQRSKISYPSPTKT